MKIKNNQIIIVKRYKLNYPFVLTQGKCHILCVINGTHKINNYENTKLPKRSNPCSSSLARVIKKTC